MLARSTCKTHRTYGHTFLLSSTARLASPLSGCAGLDTPVMSGPSFVMCASAAAIASAAAAVALMTWPRARGITHALVDLASSPLHASRGVQRGRCHHLCHDCRLLIACKDLQQVAPAAADNVQLCLCSGDARQTITI